MEAAIDANAPLDCIEFLIFPMQNRYEACVSYLHKKEKVSSGLLEHLLQHSAKIRELHSKGTNSKYGLSPPEYSHDIKWFTKSTLIRFLHIIGSANILEVTNLLKNEISQLEEARRFHLSLYAKGTKAHQSEEIDSRHTNGIGSTTQAEEADISKNKLLHAIDSRLTALRGELTTAFDQAAGSRYSVEEMTDIEKFSRHFGSLDLSDSLHKHIELRKGAQGVESSASSQFLEGDTGGLKEGNNHINESLSSEMQVRYDASPAKVAQVERQSSTGSDESSFSSEEEKQPERSRPLVRSASPRRSASPMRRVQIGRSGSRRSTAITIKSLNYVPARDKSFLPTGGAASDSEEEESQQEPKKSDNNVRISVQDAISLFERKQKDQKVDIRKSGSFSNATVGANKSVLRRWSSGVGEDSSHPQDASDEDSDVKFQNGAENGEVKHDSQESEARPDVVSEDSHAEPCGSDVKVSSAEQEVDSPVALQDETLPAESTDANEKLISSAEWNRQKEAELNELLMKMMQTKPTKNRTVIPASNKRHSLPSEQRGGFYDHYKEKRDEKLRGETTAKREKDKQFKPMQQVPDERKSQVSSANVVDGGRKHSVKKVQKPQKSPAEPANRRTESPKPAPVKKATPRSSSVPHTRKSWSSVPSPRGVSPAKTPSATSAGTTKTHRRPRSTTPVSRSNSKVETPQIGTKPVKSNQNDTKKTLGNAAEKKQQSVTKPRKTVRSKAQTAPDDKAPAAKPSLYSKVTKKNSVVPLESKPFLRKGSGAVSNPNPAMKKKPVSSPPEALRNSADLTTHEEQPVEVSNPSDPLILHKEEIEETPMVMENGMTVTSLATDDNIESVIEPQLKPKDDDVTISPAAWVEIEEHENQPAASEDNTCEAVDSSPAHGAPVGGSSPRVRYSLSQMLLEESSESDVPDWGNAANPPQVVDHKDLPKGLKRLLKFARKGKTDTNAGGLSSPSVFSEGEDDAAENLLRKATLHSKNNESAQPNLSKFNALSSSQQSQDGLVSASATTTKARSFFSLSAFKGNK